MASVIQCDACGGSVVYDAGKEAAQCLFCGSVALRPETLDRPIPEPDVAIPFEVSEHRAAAAFRRWATSSWWYPKALRDSPVELHAVMLPAWRFDADVETHWAGLTPARTKSGVRPRAGVERRLARAMVPASMGLTEPELHRIMPFDERLVREFVRELVGDGAAIPYELPALSETGAEPVAHARMHDDHCDAIAKRENLSRCRGSSMIDVTHVRLLMLPIYIGTFRYRDLPWRFVINAQSGSITGKPPLDRLKIALVSLAVALVTALWWWLRSRS